MKERNWRINAALKKYQNKLPRHWTAVLVGVLCLTRLRIPIPMDTAGLKWGCGLGEEGGGGGMRNGQMDPVLAGLAKYENEWVSRFGHGVGLTGKDVFPFDLPPRQLPPWWNKQNIASVLYSVFNAGTTLRQYCVVLFRAHPNSGGEMTHFFPDQPRSFFSSRWSHREMKW